MKVLVAVALLAIAGCTKLPLPASGGQKKALEKMLAPRFSLTALPEEKQADVYVVLEVFAKGRRSDEFIQRVEFAANGDISLFFSNSGMHGGGVANFRKRKGQWIEEKVYFM